MWLKKMVKGTDYDVEETFQNDDDDVNDDESSGKKKKNKGQNKGPSPQAVQALRDLRRRLDGLLAAPIQPNNKSK